MCGIIGIVSESKTVSPLILEGLKRLEYRGYDSAGIATVDQDGIHRARAKGKIVNLEERLQKHALPGVTGIGHTRWATHGSPTETNAHPHATPRVAVVHNGIIENYRDLREELTGHGYVFESETDTETVPVLVTYYLDQGLAPRDAVSMAVKRLEGAFALAIAFAELPGTLFAARHGAPLAVGFADHAMLIGSDAMALSPLASKVAYLEDGDWIEISAQNVAFYDANDHSVTREARALTYSSAALGKGNYRHFMQKEIHEQPGVVADTIGVYYNPTTQSIALPDLPFDLARASRVNLVACGTSYYAGMVARYWLEQIARVPADLDVASEFRYREPLLDQRGITLAISQSGETADTLAALRYVRRFQPCIGVVNVPESSIAREASAPLYTYAGPEIGVASTKAFTTQLAALGCFTIALAAAQGAISADEQHRLSRLLVETPSRMSDVLKLDGHIAAIAPIVAAARDVLYLGRGTSYPIALEGALKLKEISYIHAEGYAAGEMKHGPIALIDEHVPIIAIAPSDALFDKTASNLQEAAARGGKIILISDQQGCNELGDLATATILMPDCDPFIAPLLYSIPIQMLAYHTAVLKGTDVDQPRNLAKSVTVE